MIDQNLSNARTGREDTFVSRFVLQVPYWILPLLLWSLLVVFSYRHNTTQIESQITEMAANKGRFVFDIIQDMRLWNARHGGIYVLRTEQSPSNPYLMDPEKDVTTNLGQELTKINPAYMTRQVASVIREKSGTSIHITSLKPINPDNAADDWEVLALNSFEKGKKENFDFLDLGPVKQFRYMARLVTQEACMQCHVHQGYQVGDVRGGISVSFSSQPFLQARDEQINSQRIVHIVTWILLCAVTLLALSALRHHMLMLIAANEEQEAMVALRTKDLHQAQAQFRRFIDASAEGIIALDKNGMCTFANPIAAELLQKEDVDAIIGQDLFDLIGRLDHDLHPIERKDCAILACIAKATDVYSEDELFTKAGGETFSVEYFCSPVLEKGHVVGAILTFNDITRRKERESELLKLSTAVAQSPASTMITDRKGRIEYVNRRFTEISGYSEKEVLGKTPRLLKSGQTPVETYKKMWECLTRGQDWQGELLNKRKDGTLFWEETLISPIIDKYGDVTHFVAIKRDITAYKMQQEAVWRQANYDSLTNLPNRSLFEDRLETAIALAQREERTLALLFIDLDGFKEVNDTYGHEVGDHVLKETARHLQSCLRSSDTAARLGGDEFVVILQDVKNRAAVENVAGKIIESISLPITFEEHTFSVSASIGVAQMPDDAKSSGDLMRFADVAMYGAKQQGKNRFCHYCDFVSAGKVVSSL